MFQILFQLTLLVSALADIIVDIPDGKIRGHEINASNVSFYAFEGIPFASPPVGKLRFQAPVPPEPWEDILEANRSGKCCISGYPDPSESEDCLFLNVYTPPRNITKQLPVLVWIYGGALLAGCSSFEEFAPGDLANEDVIVVTFNYRLGVYGFLSTGDDVILGNAGLKDQLFAFQWVKKNIAFFGGDPDKVTLFGQSAGGISIGIHIANKKSQGLYRAAICQSGCSLTPLYQNDPKTNAYAIAKLIDSTITDANTTVQIRDFLQNQSVDDLSPVIGIVLEVENDDAYVTDLNFALIESGNFVRVPLMIGTVAEESLGQYSLPVEMIISAISYDSDVKNLIPGSLTPLPGTNLTEVGNIIKEAYIEANGSFILDLAATAELSSTFFVRPTFKQAELQSNYTPVYLYQFSFYGTASENRTIIEGAGRTGHSDELPYLFNITAIPLVTDADFLTRRRIIRLWSNFAKTLNPTPDESDPLLNVTWPLVSPSNIQYLDIDNTLEVKPNLRAKQMAMWNRVYYTYGQQPFVGF
ncbi:acylcarnitine hydrolase-like [Cylas formicarius]|uniref:acylcarnitine hydrolase-like n=1 Tax=Cylas formicarius TaxID=197179 RepID=UPI002958A3A9|nr:acylcarnitine hydrolase-like [Cylas formicarius]